MRNGKLFREFGLALYGNGWESKVARDLHTDSRTVRRWFNGTTVIPDAAWSMLRKRLQLRKLELEELLERLG